MFKSFEKSPRFRVSESTWERDSHWKCKVLLLQYPSALWLQDPFFGQERKFPLDEWASWISHQAFWVKMSIANEVGGLIAAHQLRGLGDPANIAVVL